MKKSGIVAIVGRPNVGKSTLLNSICGEKVAIVSPKPQTTRTRIMAAAVQGETQIVFMDTPGLHKSRNKLGDFTMRAINESLDEVDAVLLLVEPIANVGKPEQMILERVKEQNLPCVLVINKADTVAKEQLLPVIERYAKAHDFIAILPISAKENDGVGLVFAALEALMPDGPQLFPDDMKSDVSEKQMAAELVREKLLLLLQDEIPHGLCVVIEQMGERPDGLLDISAAIYCEREAHKSIVIGHNGAMLKRVGEYARSELERYFKKKVYLQTWVKVKENWRDQQNALRTFGYE